jgi:hypothetical protein
MNDQIRIPQVGEIVQVRPPLRRSRISICSGVSVGLVKKIADLAGDDALEFRTRR